MVVEPGDLLCFSGAHLHASVPNTSAEARVSVELRTVNRDDLEEGRGAPDLDGRAPVTPLLLVSLDGGRRAAEWR